MEKRLFLDTQGATQLRNFIRGTIPVFERAMNSYSEETVKVGGRIFSSTWDSKTFRARVVNTLNEAANICQENRPMDPILEKINFVQRWCKHIYRINQFSDFKTRVQGIRRIYGKISREELQRARSEQQHRRAA